MKTVRGLMLAALTGFASGVGYSLGCRFGNRLADQLGIR